jgi:hypothetical protein
VDAGANVDGHAGVVQSNCSEPDVECMARSNAAAKAPARHNELPATALRLVALRGLLNEPFLSVDELIALHGYTYHKWPVEIARTLLAHVGLPVVCLRAPGGTATRHVAELTFYGLAETDHVVAVMLRAQQAALQRLQGAQTLNMPELRRHLRRQRGGQDVPIAAILTTACGSEEAAARLLHAKLSDVCGAATDAAAGAEVEARRYVTLLLIECMKEGVTDPTLATRVMKDRARRTQRAEQANAASSPDVHDLQGTPEDTLFAQAVRDGIQFVMTSDAVRFSEFQTVKVGNTRRRIAAATRSSGRASTCRSPSAPSTQHAPSCLAALRRASPPSAGAASCRR